MLTPLSSPENPQQIDDRLIPIFGSPLWDKMGEKDRVEVRRHQQAHSLSQFMHGEQGALMAAARIVQSVRPARAARRCTLQLVGGAT